MDNTICEIHDFENKTNFDSMPQNSEFISKNKLKSLNICEFDTRLNLSL